MTDFPISALPSAGALDGSEKLPLVQLGATKSLSLATLIAYLSIGAAGVASFNGRTGVVTQTSLDITNALGYTPVAPGVLSAYAALASPTFSGVPAAPTAAPGTNTTQLATTAFVTAAIAANPGGLTSFNSRTGAITLLSADVTGALGYTPSSITGLTGAQSVAAFKTGLSLVKADVGLGNVDNTSDANKPVSTAQAAADALKANIASPAFTGTPTAPTAAANTNTTQIATTAYVDTGLALKAPLASPTFTGTPAVPTAAPGTNTTQVASTAFVTAAVAAGGGGVASFNTRTGAVTLTSGDVTTALGYTPTSVTGLTGTQSVSAFKTGLTLVKADVGLGNVDNTADTAKPVSTAQQTALNLKADLASPTFTGTPTAPTQTAGNNTTALATTAFVQAAIAGGTAGVASFNSRTGIVTLTSLDVTTALGFTPGVGNYSTGGALGTPSSATLTNATGLPVSTGISGLGTGIATALAVNVGTTGSPVVNGGALGTPSSGTLTNCTIPVGGITGLGTGVATALAAAVNGTGAISLTTSPAFVTPNLGTPSAGTLTNCTGLPVATGIGGLATGVATFLATPTSANLAAAVTNETGSGALVFATSPTLVTPVLGTPTSGTLTNCIGLPVSTGVAGLGTGVATALAVAVGSAGAPVTNGGALGTPSSGNLSNCTVDGTSAVGFREIPQNSQITAYTAVLADNGKHLFHPASDNNARTFTIPANASVAYPIGTALTFINKINVLTIAITTDTLTMAGTGSTGSRTLAANGIATAVKITSTEWLISGTGLT